MKKPLSGRPSRNPSLNQFGLMALCLVLLISFLFRNALRPGYTLASNDGPLGIISAACARLPDVLFGFWQDLNWLGGANPSALPDLTQLLSLVCGPLFFSKIYAPAAILFVGLCAWFCFRQWRLAPPACILGGLAAALNSDFFSTACWGVASQPICFGFNFLALAALADESSPRRWLKVILAGFAVGMGVIEGFDIGAIFSLFIAAFVICQALTSERPRTEQLAAGFSRLAVVALAAAFIAAGTLMTLIGTQIKGVAGAGQDKESKQEHWAWATQWSLPKREVISLVIPGLFGFRMDTPEGGVYWGAIGQDLGWDRYFAGGPLVEGDMVRISSPVVTNLNTVQVVNREGEIVLPEIGPLKAQGLTPGTLESEISRRFPAASGHLEIKLERPRGPLRFSGGGIYAGVIVVLLASWAVLQALRKNSPFFTSRQRRYILFWSVVVVVSMCLGFGRFAPFYQWFYALPYVSTIRNPAKFFHVVSWALVILFAYGIHGLSACCMDNSIAASRGLSAQLRLWWKSNSLFDKNFVRGLGLFVLLTALSWWAYDHSRERLVAYLEQVDFESTMAAAIATFSARQVGWFVLFLTISSGLLVLLLSGYFSGPRTRLGVILIGIVLVVDLMRANTPWVIPWNWQEKYASNPVIDILREKPFLHRASVLPFRPPGSMASFNQLYDIEWKQQLFPYYNIQSLDIIMMPRATVEYVAFETALAFQNTPDTVNRFTRRWELTNNRYLLGAAGFLQGLNQQFDPGRNRFKIVSTFDLMPKPGVINPTAFADYTAVSRPDGQYALFEFTGALPRAMLFSDWQINTNDSSTLELLASPKFDPARTVLVNQPLSTATAGISNQSPGTVEFLSYAPKHLVLHATAAGPAVLLLNDKYDPNWRVSVDGKPASLLRCNYVMRGVEVPAGEHRVEFQFAPPHTGLYITLVAMVIGLGLIGFLVFAKPDAVPSSEPNVPMSTSNRSAPARK